MNKPLTLYYIPVCPFCQRVEILLALKGLTDQVALVPVDITQPRPHWLLEKTAGTTAMPVLETEQGHIIKESLVILQYLETRFPALPVAQSLPWPQAVEGMLISMAGDLITAGYQLLMNQSLEQRDKLVQALLAHYRQIDAFLLQHAPDGEFLFQRFGMAEVVFTPVFMRFWFLDYYEDWQLPDAPGYQRVARWRDACLAHQAAQQVSQEQIIKLYYDYSRGVGNGALPVGRTRSSMAFEPHWSARPWPPRGKVGPLASDAALGLI